MDKLEVLADAGYFSGEKILECDEADITATLVEQRHRVLRLRRGSFAVHLGAPLP